jgi:hypothetical protein
MREKSAHRRNCFYVPFFWFSKQTGSSFIPVLEAIPQSYSSPFKNSKRIQLPGRQKTGVSLKFYGCETWSPTLREEHRLRVFENRVLRRIFGPKRDEMTGE